MNPTSLETFRISQENHIARISINRPEKANALDEKAWSELGDAINYTTQEDHIRAIVLYGEGKHFCSGIDLQFLQTMQKQVSDPCPGRMREKLLEVLSKLQHTFTQIEKCPKPVLAAIHGACVGGGLDLAAACDFRYAAEDATFSIKEVDMGIVADMGSLQRLPHIIGEGILRELVYTGRRFSAQEALEMKLVNQVLPDKESLLEAALDTASDMAAKSPLVVRGAKQVMLHARDHSVSDGLEFVATWNAAMLLSEDLEKSLLAALKGEKPIFR